MPEIATKSYEAQSQANTASGRAMLISEQVTIPALRGCTTMNTLSNTPIWTSRVIVQRDATTTTTHLLREVSFGSRKVAFDSGLLLAVTVERDGSIFVASDERFGLYGSGSSYEEALADYSKFFVEFFTDLDETPYSELPRSTCEFKRTLLAFGKITDRG